MKYYNRRKLLISVIIGLIAINQIISPNIEQKDYIFKPKDLIIEGPKLVRKKED